MGSTWVLVMSDFESIIRVLSCQKCTETMGNADRRKIAEKKAELLVNSEFIQAELNKNTQT